MATHSDALGYNLVSLVKEREAEMEREIEELEEKSKLTHIADGTTAIKNNRPI